MELDGFLPRTKPVESQINPRDHRMGLKDEKGARWLSPPGDGYGFEEDFADLIELNGYRIGKTTRSEDGGSEMIATRTDEVGHQITYVIYCKRSEHPADEADVERSARARERHPGSVCVVVSPSAGFSRSAADLAERRGIRLWGPREIERLRRNVVEKRSLRQKEMTERSNFGEKKRRPKAKLAAMLLLILIAALYVNYYGFEPDPIQSLISDLAERSGLVDQEIAEIYRSQAPILREKFEIIIEHLRELHKA